jgi:ABC-type branched-subunit amino acid transport system permease subunit
LEGHGSFEHDREPGLLVFRRHRRGIYTLFALGIQVQFGYAGLLNFGQVAFMGIGALHDGHPRRQEGPEHVVAAGCGIALAVLAGLLLGLPTLRLRADYFAITTIAFSEILRYVATNEDSLTGGSQGTINLPASERPSQYDGAWQSFSNRSRRMLHVGRRHRDAHPRRGTVALLAVCCGVCPDAHSLGARAAVDPRGRGRRSLARQERLPLQAPGAGDRRRARSSGRACSTPGSSASSVPDDFAPLLTFFAWMIVISGRARSAPGPCPSGALVFGVIFAGTRFFDFAPFSLLDSTERAYVRLIVIGLVIIG